MKALNSGNRRGLTLGTVLLCMICLILLLLTAGTAAVSHLRFATAQETSEHAKNLAESAIAEAFTRLVQSDFSFGVDGLDSSGQPARVEVTVPDLPGATGVVTFDSSESGFSQAYSSNNIRSDAAISGARGRTVPGRSVHLVARGRVGSTERWVECIYYRPPFPDGLACTGLADARSVYLAAVRHVSDYPGGDPRTIPPEDALPANIFSNSQGRGGRPSTQVSGSSVVTGSVGAVGPVSVSGDSEVEGEILPHSESRAIPDIRLDEKFSIVEENNTPVSSTGGDLTLEPNFFMLASHGLEVGGDLDMNGSVLLVKGGDLTVHGGIKGTGIVLCSGDVEIRDGRSHLDTAEQVAVGCKGSFRLRAEAPEGNYFNGLVYAEGDIEAKDITVVGAVVGNGKRGAEGDVLLDNVRFIYNPGSLQVVAFPPLVTAREWNNDAQFSMASATVRPRPDGSGWLVDAWAGLQVTKRPKTKAEKAQYERGVNESDWNLQKIKAISPGTFIEKTWKDISVDNGPLPSSRYEYYGGPFTPAQQLALQQSHAYEVAMREVANWLDANDNQSDTGPGKGSWFDRMSAGFKLNKNGPNPDYPPEDGTTHILEIVNSYRAADTNQMPSKVVHFNLNNLLAEFNADNARVLLWRDF